MGIVKLLASLFKAIPSLERLVYKLADALKEANANNRLEDKLAREAAPEFTRAALKKVAKLEYEIERR